MNITSSSLLTRYRTLPPARRTILLLFVLCTGVLALAWLGRPVGRSGQRDFPGHSALVAVPPGIPPDADLKAQWERIKQAQKKAVPAPSLAEQEVITPLTDGPGDTGPMIAHAAELAVSTKEFAHSRANLEEILERHHAYAAKLRMVGQPAASSLTATLRVPSSEFASAVNDLKTLGVTFSSDTNPRANPACNFVGGGADEGGVRRLFCTQPNQLPHRIVYLVTADGVKVELVQHLEAAGH